jgi:hypothetical protein
VKQEDYGMSYLEDLFEEYKQCLASIEITNNARRSTDKFYLSVNTLLLSVFSFALTSTSIFAQNTRWGYFLSLIGVTLCIIWGSITMWHMEHNRIKHLVARCIEKRLPVQLLSAEAKVMTVTHPWMSRYSAWFRYATPWIFALLYIVIPFIV